MLFTVTYFERCRNRVLIISMGSHLGFKCTESNLVMSIKYTFRGWGTVQDEAIFYFRYDSNNPTQENKPHQSCHWHTFYIVLTRVGEKELKINTFFDNSNKLINLIFRRKDSHLASIWNCFFFLNSKMVFWGTRWGEDSLQAILTNVWCTWSITSS